MSIGSNRVSSDLDHRPKGWSKAVIAHFDELQMDLGTLIEVHLRTHFSTARHAMWCKYRKAVYVFEPAQADAARRAIEELNADFDGKLITEVLEFDDFRQSDTRYHNYYENDPELPFCRRYIDPKLELVRRRFSKSVKP